MGKIVVVQNGKGGVGKTTTSVNMGIALAKAGHSVMLIDTAPNMTATKIHAARELGENERHPFELRTASEGLRELVPALARQFDYVIVDGAPFVARTAGMLCSIADLVLIPASPSYLDAWDCDDLVDLVMAAREARGTKPAAAFLLSRVKDQRKISGTMRDALTEKGLQVLAAHLSDLLDFVEPLGAGMGAADLSPSTKAHKQIAALVDEVKEIMQ